jgi:hypothetical protein
MASIQRLVSPLTKEISFREQVRVKGAPSQSKTFASRKDAEKWSKSIEAAVNEGRYFPTARASRTDFAAAVQRYRDSVLAELKDRSRHTRKQHLELFIEQFKGTCRAIMLRPCKRCASTLSATA